MKNNPYLIAVATQNSAYQSQAELLAQQLGLPCVDMPQSQYEYLLVLTEERLELHAQCLPRLAPIYVDFVAGKLAHRRLFGGGRRQLISRAVGLHKEKNLKILDLTAGLGRDAFVFASLGAEVMMLERSPIISALLADGLRRAQQCDWLQNLNLKLTPQDAQPYLASLKPGGFPDVIYLDPMYPEAKKSAQVKKEMRMLRAIVGADTDAPGLLGLALTKVRRRVVVKRAKMADYLAEIVPSFSLKGASSRFDVYLVGSV